MFRRLLPILYLASWILSFHASAQQADVRLKVMTFNIRYDNPADGIYSWKSRKKMVFKVIHAESPSVLGFQEVLKNQLSDLKKALPGYRVAGVGRDDGKSKGEYSPVLFDNKRFSLEKNSTFWLSETPAVPGSISWNAACTRIVTWAELKDRLSGEDIFVFNTHFDHVSEEARVNSARLLLDSIRSIAGNARVILTGDFNCTLGDPALQTISHMLNDCRQDAALVADFPTTFIGFPADTTKREVIDHIFISKDNWPRVRRYAVVLYNLDGRYPSDHLPVTAELE
jgi:endonuclease/exonuclease/phosphatase family metal-dependent hydrolase